MKKYFIALVILTLFWGSAKSQNILSQQTQVEVGVGYIQPLLFRGKELLRSQDLRNSQNSYYLNSNGTRKQVGSYSRASGYNFSIGFYKPLRKIKGLMLGSIVRNAQTGSTPSEGGYEEAYFFNFITAGAAIKYYPFEKNNLFVKADFGIAAVLTKNRFVTESNEQNFFHQFGIGNSLGAEIGYGLTPFKNKTQSIELKAGFQLVNTRVEVNGVGDDQWQFGALFIGTSYNF